eukprot:scaffold64415_cov27-Tisochrysis_lutea.AAC.2
MASVAMVAAATGPARREDAAKTRIGTAGHAIRGRLRRDDSQTLPTRRLHRRADLMSGTMRGNKRSRCSKRCASSQLRPPQTRETRASRQSYVDRIGSRSEARPSTSRCRIAVEMCKCNANVR